ncbi:MAG: hypothetical protein WC449_04985 [Candidatus Paceibacterota bacterium]
MAIALSQKRMNPMVYLGMAIIIAMIAVTFAYVLNQEHANTKHNEAVMIRTNIKNKVCLVERLYYSPVRGTVLVLCQIDSVNWGGLPIRFTEDYGKKFLGKDTYECTAFIGSWKYWDNVIRRDTYLSPDDFIRFADGKVFSEFIRWFEANYR